MKVMVMKIVESSWFKAEILAWLKVWQDNPIVDGSKVATEEYVMEVTMYSTKFSVNNQ